MQDFDVDVARSDGSYNAMHVDALSWAATASSIGVPLNGSASFSIDAWIRFHGIPSAAAILAQPGVFAFGSMGSALFVEVAGMPMILSDPDQSWLTDEIWHYVCATFDGGTLRLYIDGKFNSGQSLFGTPPAPSTQPFSIGEGLHGLIRRVRVYLKGLTAEDVLNNMFQAPEAGTLAADFDFTQVPAADKGPGHYPVALRGNARLVTDHPALSLGATGFARPFFDWAINPGGQQVDPYTAQAWIHVTPPASPPPDGTQQAIVVNSDLESDTGIALFLKYDAVASAYRLVSQRGSNGDTGQQLVSTGTVAFNAWTNVATTFNGTTLSVYLGGTLDNTVAAPPIPLSRPQSDLLIGSALQHGAPTGATTFQGFIEEVDIWSVCLSPTQIAQYARSLPQVPVDGLVGAYNFSHAPARNLVSGHSVGLAEGAVLSDQLSPATASEPPDDMPEPEPGLDAETLRQIRASLGSDAFRNDAQAAFAAARAADPANANRLRDLWTRLAQNPASLPFLSTEHRIGDDRLLVFHTPQRSWVGFRMRADLISDCDWWKVRLILELIVGLLSILVGLSVGASTTSKAAGYIQKMLTNPTIMSKLAVGAEMSAANVLSMLVSFQKFGFLRPLLLILLEDAGFWTMLRVFGRVVSVLAGIGIANVILMFGLVVINFVRTYMERPQDCDPPPVVTLVSIGFDYDPTASAHEALSIRKNFLVPLPYPEWTPGVLQARAAYAIAGLQNPVQIMAGFEVANPGNHAFQIQALNGGILGAIDPTPVNFQIGNRRGVILNLTHQTINAPGTGIRIEDNFWTWQYRVDNGPWQPMAVSTHRIYVVLGRPTGPWLQGAERLNPFLPWTDVLDYACTWANGATNAGTAATRITQYVNQDAHLTYNNNRGATRYVSIVNGYEFFQCGQFVNFLATEVGNQNQVNCTDCAMIVTTFANALGCNLYAGRMSDPDNPPQNFLCNPIVAIGGNAWAQPFQGAGYTYHEVAFSADWNFVFYVYDACLQVNMGTTPWEAPAAGTAGGLPSGLPHFPFTSHYVYRIPLLPLADGENTYRERLAGNNADGIPRCIPQPNSWLTFLGRRPPV